MDMEIEHKVNSYEHLLDSQNENTSKDDRTKTNKSL